MALTPKPYNIAEKIRRKIYYPSPNVLTHVDMNQATENQLDTVERFHNAIGAFSSGITITTPTFVLTPTSPTTYTLTAEVSFSAGYIYGKTVRFDSPIGLFENTGINTIATTGLPKISWWLVAKKRIVTFIDDNVMSGVDGGGFPAPVAAAETEVWENENLVQILNNTFPALAGSLEYVCQVASVDYTTVAGVVTPVLRKDALDISDFSSVFYGVTPTGDTPNSLNELINKFFIQHSKLKDELTTLTDKVANLSGVGGGFSGF